MKIDITVNKNFKKKPQVDTPKKRVNDWPVNPRKFADDPEYILDVSFFDGMTTVDPYAEDGYKMPDCYNLGEISHSASHSGGYNSFQFFQNSPEIDTEALAAEWDGSDPNREYGIFERKPMAQILYNDFLGNQEVIPTGATRPNFEVKLLYPDGDQAGVVDLKRIFRGGVEGFTADTIADDDIKSGYRIWEPPFYVGHISVKEVTSNAVFNFIDAELPGFEGSVIQTQNKSELEGIFWLPFDTSDTENYKLTLEPSYDAEEFTEPPVKMLSQYTTLRIFTMRRRWWGWAYNKADSAIKGWGLWHFAPRDFEMPTPRKQGSWELAHAVICTYHMVELDDWTILDEDNAHAIFSFTSNNGDSDSDSVNGIFTLFSFHEMHTLLSGEWNDWYHVPWLASDTLSWNYMYEPLAATNDWIPHLHSGNALRQTTIIETMPDLKCPNLFGSLMFATKDCYEGTGEPGSGPNRTVRAWSDPETNGFNQDGKDQKAKLWDAIKNSAGAQACPFGAPPDEPLTWGVAAAGAKEGDLVAVLECGDGRPIFVWRKTDETFIPKEPLWLTDSLYFCGTPDNVFYSGDHKTGNHVVNCQGIVEWECSKLIGDDSYEFNRIIRYWGSWFEISGGIVTPHRETIDLGQDVSVIAYFGVFPGKNLN